MLTITTMRGTVINVDQAVPDNLALLYSSLPLDLDKYHYVNIIKSLLEENINNIIHDNSLSKVQVNGIKYLMFINNYNNNIPIYYTIIAYDNQLCFLAEDLHKQLKY